MKQKTKSRIALSLAAVLATGAIAAICTMCDMTDQATNFDPNPQQTQQTKQGQDEAAEDDESAFRTIDWTYWQSVDPNVIGWITIPGTNIDYPIVQASESNPTYYLTHDIYGSYNYHGIPYLSYRCVQGGLLDSKNALVFGHSLLDGTMFSQLTNFIDANYATEHSPIVIQTPQTNATLTVLAVDRVNANDEAATLEFTDEITFKEWLTNTVNNANLTLATAEDLAQATNVVTLCTCSYSTWNNERTLVICSVNPEEAN